MCLNILVVVRISSEIHEEPILAQCVVLTADISCFCSSVVSYVATLFLQVMIDFQAAEKKRLGEPASEIGLEPLCAMVSVFFKCFKC